MASSTSNKKSVLVIRTYNGSVILHVLRSNSTIIINIRWEIHTPFLFKNQSFQEKKQPRIKDRNISLLQFVIHQSDGRSTSSPSHTAPMAACNSIPVVVNFQVNFPNAAHHSARGRSSGRLRRRYGNMTRGILRDALDNQLEHLRRQRVGQETQNLVRWSGDIYGVNKVRDALFEHSIHQARLSSLEQRETIPINNPDLREIAIEQKTIGPDQPTKRNYLIWFYHSLNQSFNLSIEQTSKQTDNTLINQSINRSVNESLWQFTVHRQTNQEFKPH